MRGDQSRLIRAAHELLGAAVWDASGNFVLIANGFYGNTEPEEVVELREALKPFKVIPEDEEFCDFDDPADEREDTTNDT